MICQQGYKAFKGTMIITLNDTEHCTFTVYGDWLYNPLTKCWYCGEKGYQEDMCQPLEDNWSEYYDQARFTQKDLARYITFLTECIYDLATGTKLDKETIEAINGIGKELGYSLLNNNWQRN